MDMHDAMKRALDKDSLLKAIDDLRQMIDKHFDDDLSMAIVFSQDNDKGFHFYGSDIEIIGLLELGKESFMDSLYRNGDIPKIDPEEAPQ